MWFYHLIVQNVHYSVLYFSSSVYYAVLFIRTALQHQQPNYYKHFKSPHSFIHSFSSLSYDRSKTSSKASSLLSAF